MTHEYALKYLQLRKEGKIGKIWVMDGHKLAPVEALPGLEYQLAEYISEVELEILIDGLLGLEVKRKPVQREWDHRLRRMWKR